MASNFPTSLDSFTDPLSNSPLNNPSHAGQHQDLNNSVEQLEVKVGIGASAATSATSGQVLTANGSGGSTWQNPAVTAAQFANVGLVYITSTTFTGSSSVQIDNCFTSTHDNYAVVINGNGNNTAPQNLYVRLVNGTTPDATSIYGTSGIYSTTAAAATAFWSSIIANGYIGFIGDDTCSVFATIYQPQLAKKTSWNSLTTSFATTQFANGNLYGLTTSTTAFEGIYIFPSAGTITGTITVFGYKKG